MTKFVFFRLDDPLVQLRIAPDRTMLWSVRPEFGLTGSQSGWGISPCGACSALGHALRWAACFMALVAIALFSSATAVELPAPKEAKPAPVSAKPYLGIPYHDSVYQGGPQIIPGRLQNEYYDTMDIPDAEKAAGAEEGITYHDTDNKNDGSGALNGKGSYKKEFRLAESPDISYVKMNNPGTPVDDTPFNLVQPEAEDLYLGWIAPGEWVKYTVNVQAEGSYSLTTMYTSKFGGHISIDCDGVDVTGPIAIPSTFNAADPIEWRQAHHWNKIKTAGKMQLKKGLHVLTLHFLDQPVMNFDYMDFVKVD